MLSFQVQGSLKTKYLLCLFYFFWEPIRNSRMSHTKAEVLSTWVFLQMACTVGPHFIWELPHDAMQFKIPRISSFKPEQRKTSSNLKGKWYTGFRQSLLSDRSACSQLGASTDKGEDSCLVGHYIDLLSRKDLGKSRASSKWHKDGAYGWHPCVLPFHVVLFMR